MNDILLLETCPKCGKHITLMESINTDNQELWLVKRCLSCGQYPVIEIVEIRDQIRPELCETGDELLWQEIFSLREKLKIAVEAIKSYDPEFDAQLFMHQLNSVDYDQLMEELSQDSGESKQMKPEPKTITDNKPRGRGYIPEVLNSPPPPPPNPCTRRGYESR